VGNEYARHDQSHRLTTLLDEHIDRAGRRLCFVFRDKHGKPLAAELNDRCVGAILRRLAGLPGQNVHNPDCDLGARAR
jgi:DNA topoisomerase IB